MESSEIALSLTTKITHNERTEHLKCLCFLNRGHTKSLQGNLREAKLDFVHAFKGFSKIEHGRNLSELFDMFITALLNPRYITLDSLPLLIELIEECGVDNFYEIDDSSTAVNVIRSLPDVLIYCISKKVWHEQEVNQKADELGKLASKASTLQLNEFALITLDCAACLLMNQANDNDRAVELYEKSALLEQYRIDYITFLGLKAIAQSNHADALYNLGRDREAHVTYLASLRKLRYLRVLLDSKEVFARFEYIEIHSRRRVAELNRKRLKLQLSIRHLRNALKPAGFGIRNNSLYYRYILPDLVTALAMNKDSKQAIRLLELAVLIGIKSPRTLVRTNLCGWALIQRLEPESDSGPWTLKATATSFGAIDLGADLSEQGEQMSPYWPAMSAYNMCSCLMPYRIAKAKSWWLRAERMRGNEKQHFWLLQIGLCYVFSLMKRELQMGLAVAKVLFGEEWDVQNSGHNLQQQWNLHFGQTLRLSNSFFAPRENPRLALEIFDCALACVERVIENDDHKRYWTRELTKSKSYFINRHST